MADLGAMWESLNDKCWPLLDMLHLGDFFESNNLPPILFPIALIVIILLLLMMLSPGGPTAATCGDGVCTSASEDSTSCPSDCPKTNGGSGGRTVTVTLSQTPSCQVEVSLYDQDNELLAKDSGRKDTFTFPKIGVDKVKVGVTGSEGQSQNSQLETLSGDKSTIDIPLGDNICKAPAANTGTLLLTIKDSATNAPLSSVKVSIAETVGGAVLNYVARDTIVNSQKEFTLARGKVYRIYASKERYREVQEDLTMPSSTQTFPKAIYLEALAPDPVDPYAELTGDLEVCVVNGTTPLTEGIINLQDTAGNFVESGDLSDADPTTEPTGPGCYVFEGLTAGQIISVSMPSPPAGCISNETSPVTIVSGQRVDSFLTINCQPAEVGWLKIKVIGNDSVVLTENGTITVWTESGTFIRGTGTAGRLSMGSNGYTEEVNVPSDTELYVWVRGLPSGYLDYKQESINVSAGEHKGVTIYLNYTAPIIPSVNFTFEGAASPGTISKSENFTVTLTQIKYGNTLLTPQTATVTVKVDDVSCVVRYRPSSFQKWQANCTSPDAAGEYEIVISATYQGKTGTHTRPIEVREYMEGAGVLTVVPASLARDDPPLTLYYDIRFNDTPLATLTGQEVTIQYLDSPAAYPGNLLGLTREGGYWKLIADVPYKGAYRLTLYVESLQGSIVYNATYYFDIIADTNSDDLEATVYVDPLVLTKGQEFDITVELDFKGTPATGLGNLWAYADDTDHNLLWSPWAYSHSVVAPLVETCSLPISFYVKTQNYGNAYVADQVNAHVIDVLALKGTCPLPSGTCQSREQVRKCVSLGIYPDDVLISCIDSGCSGGIDLQCPGKNKGDLEPDCAIDELDTNRLVDNLDLWRDLSQGQRLLLKDCLDMDNDQDVDDEDLDCLVNIEARKWVGDRGPVPGDSCPDYSLRGGFCQNLSVTELPGDLNDDGRINNDDLDLMDKILTAVNAGVDVTELVLDVADFDVHGTINGIDRQCLYNLRGLSAGAIPTLPAGTISSECMRIFGVTCQAGSSNVGDLNGDGDITMRDGLILWFLVNDKFDLFTKAAATYCGDLNNDDILDDGDLTCIEYYFNAQDGGSDSDEDWAQWLACRGCTEAVPPAADGHGQEICNDNWDNNCDGFKNDEDPKCACDATTPCTMLFDTEPLTDGVADGKYKLCRRFDWIDFPTPYGWYTETQIEEKCTQGAYPCHGMYCNGAHYKTCSKDSSSWKWFDPAGLPGEICGDNVDNDCTGGDSSCSSCFPTGTRILMADGTSKNIEDIRIGDSVMSYDLDSKAYAMGEVLKIDAPVRPDIYTMTFTNGETLRLTSEHPLYVENKGWASIDPSATFGESGWVISKLEVGDKVLNSKKEFTTISSITFGLVEGGIRSYDLTVAGHNNYFADGFLAHNHGGKWHN